MHKTVPVKIIVAEESDKVAAWPSGCIVYVTATNKYYLLSGGEFTQFEPAGKCIGADGSLVTPGGSAGLSVATRTTDYTVLTGDNVILANGTLALTLYTAVGNSGKVVTVKNIGSGIVTLLAAAGQTIDGESSWIIDEQYLSIDIISDGSNWHIT